MPNLKSLIHRRPSASMAVALVALFTALGGVGYAASTLPPGSVGRAQIQNNAVNYQKIAPGSVGIVRINPNTVQARVLNNCNIGHSAITAINSHGQPICKGVLPSEYDTTSAAPVTVGSGSNATTIAGELLSGATSYLVLATPDVQVSGTAAGAQEVTVTCSLSASPLPGSSQSRSVTVDLSGGKQTAAASLPLVLTETGNSTSDTVSVACTQTINGSGATPTVNASTEINAIETGGNTTQANAAPGSTTTTTTPTTTTNTPSAPTP